MNGKPDISTHLLIRFSDNLFGVGDAIARHQEVLQQHGSVWFGKLGTPIGKKALQTANEQIELNISSFLYLVKGNRKRSVFYQARMLALSAEFPKQERIQIPPYYFEKDLITQMKSWVKITDIRLMEPAEVKRIRVKSSVLRIEETLFRSSAGLFYVVHRKENEL